MTGTIRSRMEAIKARHVPVDHFDVYDQPMPEPQCRGCTRPWPCPDRVAADDTLTDLDNAERRFQGHDPENGGDVVYRLIPDPYPADDEGEA